MTRNHTPLQKLKEAKTIARDHGMFVVEKPGRYLLYRMGSERNVYIGFRSDIGDFRSFVESCAYRGKKAH